MATSKEIKEEYTSSLADLTFNSKPLISVLTMLAEENVQHARDIVEAIETHLTKVRMDVKLPVLYLIDCIIKNVGGPYLELFCQNIVPTFCSVFQSVDERTRAEMFKLRQTWTDYLPAQKLYALDVQIKMLDPAWPVSAKPPSGLIHVNPKFLNSTSTANVSAAKKAVSNKTDNKILTTTPVSTAANLDPKTLDMQQKLINKQKQLIELQQRKLELELLQAQVKLQEQLKNTGGAKLKTSTASSVSQGNPLLKPEVAKQMVNTTAGNKPNNATSVTTTSAKPKPAISQTSSVVLNQKLHSLNATSNSGPKIAAPNSALIAASSRTIRDPRLRRQQPNQNSVVNSNVQLESKPQVDSTNKIVVNSKTNVRETRTEPRTVNNKVNTIVPSEKIKSLTRPLLKSRIKLNDESVRKPIKSSKGSDSGDSSSKSSSTSSLDSPTKVKKDKKLLSPTKSPIKFKKKDKVSPTKGESRNKPTKSDPSSPTFKDIKQSMKNRNYIRRNRKTSESPEAVQDVDLRPRGPPEKQPRQSEPVEDKSASTPVVSQGMDVDLRQLPVVGKKRLSNEPNESSNPKKSKTEMFDVLFGNEDTDLRQLPTASPPIITAQQPDKPPTPPPPPIISSRPYETKESSPKKSTLDVLRAKLNNATKKDRLNERVAKRVDVDLRNFISPQTSPEKTCKIVISPDDEQSIKADKLTADQKNALWCKIMAQMNNGDNENLGNISLQPISDEEMEGDFSEDEHEAKQSIPFGDKDDRVPPLHLQTGEYQKTPFYNNRSRMHPNAWRGRRAPKYYEGGPHMRPGPRPAIRPDGPWMRNVGGGGGGAGGPWRPMAPTQNYPRPSLAENYIQPHRAGETDNSQDGGVVENVSSHVKPGRQGPWMRNNGPWRTMGPGTNFNRGNDGFAPMHRPGDHGDYVQENVPSPDGNSNSSHIFQSVAPQQQQQQQQQNIGNVDVLSNIVPTTTTLIPPIAETGDHVDNTQNALITQPSNNANSAPAPLLPPPPLNITELLQKLVESGIVTTTASDQNAVATTEVPSKTAVKKSFVNPKPVSFSKPETLKVLQPSVFQLLYSGMQCSSCGMRFPPEQSMLYSQHLDWHFRQNRKGKKNIRKAASRRWYYSLADWKNYEEIEDLEEREKSYFDQQQAQTEGANEETEEEIEIPTVPADPNVQDAQCEVCQDRFEQFYNEEKEEWQLRMAVRVNNKTYHPLCYDDYQASLNIPIDISASEDVPSSKELEDQRIPGLEIVLDDDDDDDDDAKDENAKSEPSGIGIEEASQEAKTEAVEDGKDNVAVEEEDDDDDVILNEVAPERIILDDDDDENEETTEYQPTVKVKIEPIDDGFMDVDGVVKVKNDGEIKIKTEPKDPDDILLEMEEPPKTEIDTTHNTDVHISIDGNVEFDTNTVTTAAPTFGGKIKINISKPLPALPAKETKDVPLESDLSIDTFIDPSQPLPPGEEPVQLNVKPGLQGVELKRLPPVEKGKELTGMCSIM